MKNLEDHLPVKILMKRTQITWWWIEYLCIDSHLGKHSDLIVSPTMAEVSTRIKENMWAWHLISTREHSWEDGEQSLSMPCKEERVGRGQERRRFKSLFCHETSDLWVTLGHSLSLSLSYLTKVVRIFFIILNCICCISQCIFSRQHRLDPHEVSHLGTEQTRPA